MNLNDVRIEIIGMDDHVARVAVTKGDLHFSFAVGAPDPAYTALRHMVRNAFSAIAQKEVSRAMDFFAKRASDSVPL